MNFYARSQSLLEADDIRIWRQAAQGDREAFGQAAILAQRSGDMDKLYELSLRITGRPDWRAVAARWSSVGENAVAHANRSASQVLFRIYPPGRADKPWEVRTLLRVKAVEDNWTPGGYIMSESFFGTMLSDTWEVYTTNIEGYGRNDPNKMPPQTLAWHLTLYPPSGSPRKNVTDQEIIRHLEPLLPVHFLPRG